MLMLVDMVIAVLGVMMTMTMVTVMMLKTTRTRTTTITRLTFASNFCTKHIERVYLEA